MVVLEDFTKFRIGRDIPLEGQVLRCPRCGRPGVEQPSGFNGPIYVHAQTSEIIGDGMRTEPQDCCSLPRP
ncbi:MAG TPA: hypothetical protein VF376_14795 [Thermoanaerobaculia bacterium]